MDAAPLCPAPAELALDRLIVSPEAITVVAIARRAAAACPVCGHLAHRVHSHYTRTLADLPWHGMPVQLHASVRRFFCEHAGCRRRIFTERLSETAAPYARRTGRAARALEAIGFAVGGRPGERLASALALAGGAWAILERVRRAPEAEPPTPRALGVDDWALKRGQRYGTVLLDLERHAVIDLLPDREAATLAAWLTAHPGVALISRDRAGAYAEGARAGAPDAIQVADRFHLVRNLVTALERACARHHAALRSAAGATHPTPLPMAAVRRRRYSGLPHNGAGPTQSEQWSRERRARRLARYEHVVALAAAGMAQQQIAQAVGLDRKTVSLWLATGRFPERAPPAAKRHRVDPYLDFLLERYETGVDNAAQLRRALCAHGFRGSYQTVRRALVALRRTRPRNSAALGPPDAGASAAGPAPSPRQTAWLLWNSEAKPDGLRIEERAYVEALGTACPALARARTLASEFVQLLKRKDPNALDSWLAAAEASELRSFVAGLRRDYDAVLAAVVFTWSNGQVEGQVNRLKLLKRTMYGRASFALLRQRVLHAA